jgi:hypothetical protein
MMPMSYLKPLHVSLSPGQKEFLPARYQDLAYDIESQYSNYKTGFQAGNEA